MGCAADIQHAVGPVCKDYSDCLDGFPHAHLISQQTTFDETCFLLCSPGKELLQTIIIQASERFWAGFIDKRTGTGSEQVLHQAGRTRGTSQEMQGEQQRALAGAASSRGTNETHGRRNEWLKAGGRGIAVALWLL